MGKTKPKLVKPTLDKDLDKTAHITSPAALHRSGSR